MVGVAIAEGYKLAVVCYAEGAEGHIALTAARVAELDVEVVGPHKPEVSGWVMVMSVNRAGETGGVVEESPGDLSIYSCT